MKSLKLLLLVIGGETIDLSATEPELASKLNQATVAWLDALKAPMMKPNPEFDPAFLRK